MFDNLKKFIYHSLEDDIRSRPEYRKRFLELYEKEFTLEKREAYYAIHKTHDLSFKLMQQALLETFLENKRMLRIKRWLTNSLD